MRSQTAGRLRGMWLRAVLFVYGAINVAGGVIGLVASGSIWSLVAGVVSGLLLIGCALLAKTKPAMAYRTAGLVTFALAAFWLYRITEVLGQGKSPMMAVGNLGLAVVVFTILGGAHFAAVRRRTKEGHAG